MNIPWEKIPSWLFAAALFLFVFVLFLTYFSPHMSFQMFGKSFGFSPVPQSTSSSSTASAPMTWTFDKQYINDLSDKSLTLIPSRDGICYLSAVTNPGPQYTGEARVTATGGNWVLSNSGAIRSKAICIVFSPKASEDLNLESERNQVNAKR